eukprot:209311_1
MDAGIETPDEVIADFRELQQSGRKKGGPRYLILKIKDKKSIYVHEKNCDEDFDWDSFVDVLVENSPCFAVNDFHFDDNGVDRTKLLFVSWIPDTCRAMEKMLYSSTSEGLKTKLDGIQKKVQATDESDLDYDNVVQIVKR